MVTVDPFSFSLHFISFTSITRHCSSHQYNSTLASLFLHVFIPDPSLFSLFFSILISRQWGLECQGRKLSIYIINSLWMSSSLWFSTLTHKPTAQSKCQQSCIDQSFKSCRIRLRCSLHHPVKQTGSHGDQMCHMCFSYKWTLAGSCADHENSLLHLWSLF